MREPALTRQRVRQVPGQAVSDAFPPQRNVGCGEGRDSLLFDAAALHRIEAIRAQPVARLSVVLTLRE